MAYISSEYIKVFPSIGRDPNIDANAELMNEGNISNIIRSLCRERKSYVLSKTWTAPFEFVIYGFYFKIIDTSSLSDRPLYAHITLKENTGNYQLLTISNSTVSNNSLQILDQESQFQGVLFNGEAGEDSDGTYTLQLLDKEGKVPATSLLHIETNEILDKGTSNYISDSFTTSSLNATNATINTLTNTNATIGNITLSESTISTTDGSTISFNTSINSGSITLRAGSILTGNVTGNVSGNASTATSFASAAAVALSGDISGSVSSTFGWQLSTTINNNAVTTNKINDGAVTTDKVAAGAITTEKLDFGVTMTLTVSDRTLVLSMPELEDKNK